MGRPKSLACGRHVRLTRVLRLQLLESLAWGSAILSAVPLKLLCLLLIQGHTLSIAWRGSPAVWVPYWNVLPRPIDVFDGGPTTGKFN